MESQQALGGAQCGGSLKHFPSDIRQIITLALNPFVIVIYDHLYQHYAMCARDIKTQLF